MTNVLADFMARGLEGGFVDRGEGLVRLLLCQRGGEGVEGLDGKGYDMSGRGF